MQKWKKNICVGLKAVAQKQQQNAPRTVYKTYLHDVSLHWPFHHISFPSVRPWLCLWAGKLVTTEEDFFNLVSPLQKQRNHHHDYSFNWATFESSSFITVPHTSASLGGTRPPLWEPLLYVYQRWGEVCVGVTEAPRKHLWLWRLRCQIVFDSLCPPCNSCVPSLGGPSPTLGTTTLLPTVWE